MSGLHPYHCGNFQRHAGSCICQNYGMSPAWYNTAALPLSQPHMGYPINVPPNIHPENPQGHYIQSNTTGQWHSYQLPIESGPFRDETLAVLNTIGTPASTGKRKCTSGSGKTAQSKHAKKSTLQASN